MNNVSLKMFLGKYQKEITNLFSEVGHKNIIERIWDKDHTVWSRNPAEITNRLGWLNSTKETLTALPEINEFVHSINSEGFKNVLLLGMGGSSLAPEVFKITYGDNNKNITLHVLDSTDPGAVLKYSNELDPATTLYIVSTKSGGTVETLSLMKYFYNFVLNKLGQEKVGRHFTAITDPGSGLESMAKQLSFRKVFLNNPDIGGRYSALSLFGMVPAALIGLDLPAFLLKAEETVRNAFEKIESNLSAQLGAAIGELANKGLDKLTFLLSPPLASFGSWVEQLIAESTGKNGRGILPVVDESIEGIENYSDDRIFVSVKIKTDDSINSKIAQIKEAGLPIIEIEIADKIDLGSQFFMWEFATIVAAWRMFIQPFDQPDVESAKVRAGEMIQQYKASGELSIPKSILQQDGITIYGGLRGDTIDEILFSFMNFIGNGSYVSIQAFLNPTPETSAALNKLRRLITSKYQIASTLGYGPRFLHSTGQLHKGDAGRGLFIQFTAVMPDDAAIPDNPGINQSGISFGILKTAQALGDMQALLDKNRNVISIDLGTEIVKNIELIAAKI